MKLTKNYLKKLVVESLDEMGSPMEMEEDHIPGGNSVYVLLIQGGGIGGVFTSQEKAEAASQDLGGLEYVEEWKLDDAEGHGVQVSADREEIDDGWDTEEDEF